MCVGADEVPTPAFPNGMTNAQIIDNGSWGLEIDSGAQNVVEAEIIRGDQGGSRPVIRVGGGGGAEWEFSVTGCNGFLFRGICLTWILHV